MALSILVVEDEQDISMMLHDRLTFLGFLVTTARDGAEGLAMLDVLVRRWHSAGHPDAGYGRIKHVGTGS